MSNSGEKPDILVVLVDQLARNALSLYGDPNTRTPEMDCMAAEGLAFDALSSTFPACVPFRFSFMTGQYAHSRMVPALGFRMSPAERTLGEAVKDAGYETAYIGKWHLYSLYGIVGGQTLAQVNRAPIPANHRRGFDVWRGFELRNDFYDTAIFFDDDPTPRLLQGYQTDALFGLLDNWLDRPRPEPGFAILSLEAPHPPFTAPEAAVETVQQRGAYKLRQNVDVDAITAFPPEWAEMAPGGVTLAEATGLERRAIFDAAMQTYSAMIEVIDARLGALLAWLRQPAARPTIVVFLSDHGELGGSHGLLGKAEPFEESIGVPLIFWANDPDLVPPGRRSNLPLCTEDLFPTMVGLAGGEAEGPGLNLSDFISGRGAEPERDAVMLEFVAETRPERRYHDATWRAIRTWDMKYAVIGNADGARPWMCFDLATDSFEMQDILVADPADPRIPDLHDRLTGLLAETGDDFPISPLT